MILALTSELRGRFKKKREEFGLSRNELASILKINFMTIKRWEEGESSVCTHALSEIFMGFLYGAYDAEIKKFHMNLDYIETRQSALKMLERIAFIYARSAFNPALRKYILSRLNEMAQ